MVVKFKFASWYNVKKVILTNIRLTSEESDLVEKLVNKKEMEKLIKFLERLSNKGRITDRQLVKLKEFIERETQYLNAVKGGSVNKKLNDMVFGINRNQLFSGIKCVKKQHYDIFISFANNMYTDCAEKQEIVNLLRDLKLSANLTEQKGEKKFGNLSLDNEETLFAYSGEKKVLDIINMLQYVQNNGVISKIEKLLFYNKGKSAKVDRYIDKYLNKMFIPLNEKEVMPYIIDDERILIKALTIYNVYNVLCNICYQAVLKNAVIIADMKYISTNI